MTIVCAFTASTAQALIISEVMFNPVGGFFGNDDGLEYVELFNDGPTPIDLSNYSLGWGGTDYTFGSFAMTGAGTLNPGEYIVVGNTGSGFDFNPDLPDGFINAAGVALFLGNDTSITPIDAVIYAHIWGDNFNNLIDESGSAPATIDATTGAAAESIERQNGGTWAATSTPTPGAGILNPEPNTALLTGVGLVILGMRRRRV